jgi:hypothetical protein
MKLIQIIVLGILFFSSCSKQDDAPISEQTEELEQTLEAKAEWLSGSLGARLYVRAGETLDDYVDNKGYDYVAGAQEIISSYPSMGHVITNATNNAKITIMDTKN